MLARENGEMPAMEPVRARYSEHSHADQHQLTSVDISPYLVSRMLI
jgi:hypothetical protein